MEHVERQEERESEIKQSADELEQQGDELEQSGDQLQEQIDETRDEWEQKQQSIDAPGAQENTELSPELPESDEEEAEQVPASGQPGEVEEE